MRSEPQETSVEVETTPHTRSKLGVGPGSSVADDESIPDENLCTPYENAVGASPPYLSSRAIQMKDFQEDNSEKPCEAQLQICTTLEESCKELANVEVALRRYAQHNYKELSKHEVDTRRNEENSDIARNDVSTIPKQTTLLLSEFEFSKYAKSKRSLHTKMRQMRSKLQKFNNNHSELYKKYVDFALCVTSSVPSVTDLEDDQLRQIFRAVLQLSGNCPSSMIVLSQVCKRWKRLSLSSDVWTALHLNKNANSITDHELMTFLGNGKSFSRLTSISLASCLQITEHSLDKLLLHSGSNLTWLDISGCWNLREDALTAIVECCPNLKHLDMSRCSGISLEQVFHSLDQPNSKNNNKTAKTLKQLGVAYMGDVCHRVSRQRFEDVAQQLESFLEKYPNISVGNTRAFFRFCMRTLSDIPYNTDQSMCQGPYCQPGDGEDAMSTLQLLPRCGHLICLSCENLARGNVRTVVRQASDEDTMLTTGFGGSRRQLDLQNGAQSLNECHIYPCPTCSHDMGPPSPCSKSFSIML